MELDQYRGRYHPSVDYVLRDDFQHVASIESSQGDREEEEVMFAEATWGEYGALGLAVLALGTFVMFLMKQHYGERKEMLDRQLDERKEWREDAQSRQGELQRVVTSLENVIREQGSK